MKTIWITINDYIPHHSSQTVNTLFFLDFSNFLIACVPVSLSPQSFLALVNLLSSSQSVWELLGQQPLANKAEYTLREMPSSVPVSVFHTM